MTKKKFEIKLNIKDLNKLKKQIENYRDNELPGKCKEYVRRLAEIGLNTAEVYVNQSPIGKYVTLRIEDNTLVSGHQAILIATGEVKKSDGREDFSTILAIEFGTGSYWNKEKHPQADELGYGPGTFPGQIHAFEDGWFYWDEKAGEWRYTHGIKATMPMHQADIAIISDVKRIAMEVFI